MSLSWFDALMRRPVRHRARRGLRWLWRSGVMLLAAVWSIGLLAWLTLQWGILPRLDEWRPQIEAQATRALGLGVQIGRLSARSSGWVPAFELDDVVLRDRLGREALRLPRVAVALSVPSLLALRLRFEQLLMDGARLEVRRDAQGRWHVAGLDVENSSAAVDEGQAADWLFSQTEMIIRGGVLRWVDELRGAPPLQLDDVLLVLRNPGLRHELRLDATPPADWGRRFSLRAVARQPLLSRLAGGPAARVGDWRRWNGALFADLPLVDAAQLRHHVDLPVELLRGQAGLRAWVDFEQSRLRTLTLDAALREVSVRLDPALEPMAFAQLSARLAAERGPDGVALSVQGLQFDTADGQRWAPSTLALRWQQRQWPTAAAESTASAAPFSPPVSGGEFSADRLDLAPLAELAERLPVGSGVRRLLQQLNPAGTVTGLVARWTGPLDAPLGWQVQAGVRGLAIAAAPSPTPGGIGRPGWRGADLELSASDGGGQARLTLDGGEVELPGVFVQAVVPLTRFSARLQWKRGVAEAGKAAPAAADAPRRIDLRIDQARFANDDAQGEFSASWHTGAGSGSGQGGRLPGVLELSGTLQRGQAARVARYLPLGISAEVRDWVQHAVQGGEVRDVTYRVSGDLWDFPFVNRQAGQFRIAGQLHEVTLAPVPSVPAGGGEPAWTSPWPAFAGVSGELVFERDAMQFSQTRGRLWGLELAEVQGRIRALSPQAVLEIEGQAHGPAADLLRYVQTTPLAGWTGDALAQSQASGAADLKLSLTVPLARRADTTVKAELQLAGNDLRLQPGLPMLAGARGLVHVSHRGVQLQALRGQALGGELQIDGGSQPDGSMRFVAQGQAGAEAMRRSAELGALLGPSLSPLLGRLSGQAAYRLQLGLRHGQPELLLTSPLQGLAVDLPAPLRKPADALLPLRLQTTLQGTADAAPAQRDLLRLEVGPLQVALLRDIGGDQARVLRSAYAWASPLPEPVAGGRAVLAPERLDLDAWRALWAPGGAFAASGGGGGAAAAASEPGLPVHSLRLRTPELVAGGRRLSNLTLELQRVGAAGDEGWRAELQADQTSGTVDYREPRSPGGAGRVRARLARLSLPPAEAEQVAGLLDQAPASVPALDIEVAAFELRGLPLGQLSVQAVNRPAGDDDGARSEWRLDRLQLTNPDARLVASGRWAALPRSTRRRMELDFRLELVDGGALLARLGYGALLRGTKGQLDGVVAWNGSPLALDTASLSGGFHVALEAGRFLKADAGAARLLGVLSLQALPRRLVLDFRDLFQSGFAFDELGGDVRIAQGVASTNNLRMRGLQAAVLMEGHADIARETQDLQVVVLPELNTASASLAYAAINPAIGLGALFGQWLLREPLRQASAREFHISGSWDDPQVQRVQRRLLDPLPAIAEPAPGPGPTVPEARRSPAAP